MNKQHKNELNNVLTKLSNYIITETGLDNTYLQITITEDFDLSVIGYDLTERTYNKLNKVLDELEKKVKRITVANEEEDECLYTQNIIRLDGDLLEDLDTLKAFNKQLVLNTDEGEW